MTKAVTGFKIDIRDDATVWVSATSWEDSGYLWAIEGREMSLSRLKKVASAIGPDALEGVEARLKYIEDKLQSTVNTAEARVHELERAKIKLKYAKEALVDFKGGKDA